MVTCSYCKRNYKEPRGLTIFTFDGRTVHFCSSKCRKNLALGREARKLNWVKRRKDFVIDNQESETGNSEKTNSAENSKKEE